MTTSGIVDSIWIQSSSDQQTKSTTQNEASPPEILNVKCTCCGLIEECTQQYIKLVQHKFNGKWICGLCGEAINDEILRSSIGIDEAMNLHMSFCSKFRSSSLSPVNTKVHLINAMKQILRRSLDSPRGLRSTPTSPTARKDREIDVKKLNRSESCFSTLSS